tara:strand:+ start:164 stop:1300 length:1137 start_codon:yes stop_codon:yes gene_type:complete
MGLAEIAFNNFLSDTYNMDAMSRGELEFPRELPGFLVAAFAGLLFFWSELKMAVLAMILMAVGLAGLGFYGDNYGLMLTSMIIWSIGMHLQMPVTKTISLQLAGKDKGATMLGRLGGIRTGAAIVGGILLWMGLGETSLGYSPVFVLAALVSLVGGYSYWVMRPIEGHTGNRPTFIMRKRYTLFYLLNILFGARKQIFITFGPWVLIKVFGEPVSTIAWLHLVASGIGMFFSPQLGKIIDRFGERLVLMVDAVLLVGVCIGYGFAEGMGLGSMAVDIIYASFVLDLVLFNVGIARTTYASKISAKKDDLTATLSLGITIDHAVSMSIPTLGGLVWVVYGYQHVFIGAAIVALLTLLATSFITIPRPSSGQLSQAEAAG